MKIIICGAGKVGFSIARYLSSEENDITIIDNSEELIADISNTLDVRGITGFASHPDVLVRAGVEEADMIIAVTYADEVNMVACQIAHSLFNVPMKIARVRNKSYLDPRWRDLYKPDHMPIDLVISPELEVADAIVRGLEIPGAFDVVPFASGIMRLVGVRCPHKSPLLHTPMRLLGGLFPHLDFKVLIRIREGIPTLMDDLDELEEGDEVYLLAKQSQVLDIMAAFGYMENPNPRLLLFGGGSIGLSLARNIEKALPSVKISLVETSKERAALVATELDKTLVVHGDCLDSDLLEEVSASTSDAVIAVTSDDKVNILASMLAKKLGAKQVMALVNSSSYSSLVTSLNIDSVISPKALTVSKILHYVRRGQVHAIHSLRDGMGEIIEAEAADTSTVLGMTVSEIDLPGRLMVGAIVREENVLMPLPSLEIKPKDRVLLIMKDSDAVKHFEKLFSLRLGYF